MLHPKLHEFLDDFKQILNVKPTTQQVAPPNLTLEELRAFKFLQSTNEIVIKPADKGGATVILNSHSYIFEAYKQLLNPKYYRKIPNSMVPETAELITNILHSLHQEKFINKKQLNYLLPTTNWRARKLYLLPKIHKDLSKWSFKTIPPGRPIVSDCRSESYRIAEFLDFYLKKVSMTHDSYIKNSQHFVQKISNMKVPPQALLVTMDVESLYTNISTNDGLLAVEIKLRELNDDTIPIDHILELLRISLDRNDFRFGHDTFLQTLGCAMGKKFAPNYANIFMAKLEEEVLERFPLKPLAFSRYLDDIFMIWPHSINELKLFIQTFNGANTSIKVTEEVNEYSVNFLDLTIFKGPTFQESGYLDYKTYFKPTCSHDLIRNDSFHPKSVGPGVIKSQIIRFHRNSSRPEYINSTCRTAFLNTHKLGYSKRKLRKIKTDTLHELNHRDPTGSTPCRSHTCHTCKYISPGNIVTINHTPHNIRTKLDCSSTHVVYAIQCSKCNLFYIGQTTQKLRQRFAAHRSDIRTHKNTTIALHFNLPGHNLDQHLEITPLTQITKSDLEEHNKLQLTTLENKLIKKFDTIHPNGLNTHTHEGTSPFIPFVHTYTKETNLQCRLVREHYAHLQHELPQLFPQKLLFAFKRNPNIKDSLVKSLHPFS